MTDYQPLIRIAIRYAAGALVGRGIIAAPEAAVLTDPVTLTALSAALVSLVNEAWYWWAKRRGGAT